MAFKGSYQDPSIWGDNRDDILYLIKLHTIVPYLFTSTVLVKHIKLFVIDVRLRSQILSYKDSKIKQKMINKMKGKKL